MKRSLALLALIIAIPLLTQAQDKGYCPSFPDRIPPSMPRKTPPTPHYPDDVYEGTVTLLATISNTGYVCDVRVLHSVSRELDSKAVEAVRSRHLQPAKKDGQTIPVEAVMSVDFWKYKNGEIVPSTAPPNSN